MRKSRRFRCLRASWDEPPVKPFENVTEGWVVETLEMLPKMGRGRLLTPMIECVTQILGLWP